MYKAILLSIIIIFSVFSTYNVHAVSAKIIDAYGYLDESGYYVVVGEVVNVQTVPLHFIEIMVAFFDEDQEQLEQISVSTALETIHPGQISPFKVTLRDIESASLVKFYDVKIGNAAQTQNKENKLSFIFHDFQLLEDSIIVSGRISNDGTSISKNTKAMVVLYNVIGEPIRYSYLFTEPKDIFPFGSGIFSTRIKVDNTINIIGYAISAESSTYTENKRLVQVQETNMQRVQEIVDISDLMVLDTDERVIDTINVGSPTLVKLNIINKIKESREYTYILQITDQNGFVSSLSWSTGILSVQDDNIATIAWVSDKPGKYILQAFIWKSIEEPIPLVFRTVTANLQVR